MYQPFTTTYMIQTFNNFIAMNIYDYDNEILEQISDIFLDEIHTLIEDDNKYNDLIYKVIDKLVDIDEIDGIDWCFLTSNKKLFCWWINKYKYTIDVIAPILEYEDGPENIISVIELMYDDNNNLTLPRDIVEKHFKDEYLNWCGWGDRSEMLRNKITEPILND